MKVTAIKKINSTICDYRVFIIYYFIIRVCMISLPVSLSFGNAISIASKIIPLWGSWLIVNDLFHREVKINKENICIAIFTVSNIISMTLNYHGKALLFQQLSETANLVIILYIMLKGKNIKKPKLFFKNTAILICVITFILNVWSLYFFFTKSIYIADERWLWGSIYGYNYHEQRLWGVFSDPNIGSIIGGISIFLNIHLLRESMRKAIHYILYIGNSFIQLVFIVLTGSRTGIIGIVVAVTISIFITLYQSNKMHNGIFKKIGITSISSILLVGMILIISVTANSMQSKTTKTYKLYEVETSEQTIEKKEKGKTTTAPSVEYSEQDESESSTSLERLGEGNNGRFDAWNAALNVFIDNPLFGTTRSAYTIAYENSGIAFHAIHNGYIDALVAFGVIGILPIVYLYFSYTRRILRNVFVKKNQFENSYLIGMVIFLLWSALFYTETILVVSFICALFNYVISYLVIDEKGGEK